MSDCKTMDDWDGQTHNGYPYIDGDSDRTVTCCVETFQAPGEYKNECGWEGPVSETELGRSKIGSQPTALCCPECGRQLASKKGTASAGYWGVALDG